MWAECCMCESQVLNCEVTLVILCKTLLDWLAACACACEQHDREESNLSSSFHPSFSISPPIVLVNHFIDTAILLMLFQPSTSLISCTNQSIVSPLTRLFIFFKHKYILDNCKHFEVYVRLDLKNCRKSFGSKSQASILKSIGAYFAANDLSDYIWTDLKQHITSHFQVLFETCQIVASFLLCKSPCLVSAGKHGLTLCWQSPLKGLSAAITCSSEHWADTQAVSRPTHNVSFCSKKQMHGKHDTERNSIGR